MLCLHCSPPTSDPRAPEQREPHSLLTDIDWAPGASSDSPETDGRRPGSSPKAARKPPKAAPPIPEIREPGHPRSRHSPHDCPGARATTERHISRRTRRVRSSPPPAEQRATRRGTARHLTISDNYTTRNPSSDLTLSYEARGRRAPSTQSRPTFASGHDRASYSEARPLQAGARQHSTGRRMCGCVSTSGKYVLHQRQFWHMQRLQGASSMYQGGCYQTGASSPGNTLCTAASEGKCTKAAAGYFVPPGATADNSPL